MKKRIIVLAAVMLIASVSLFAVDFKAVVGQDTSASILFMQDTTKFLFNVDAELDMDIKTGHGLLVEVNPYSESGSVEFGLGVGYAYQDWISSSTSMIIGVGPEFTFGGRSVGFGIFELDDSHIGQFSLASVINPDSYDIMFTSCDFERIFKNGHVFFDVHEVGQYEHGTTFFEDVSDVSQRFRE